MLASDSQPASLSNLRSTSIEEEQLAPARKSRPRKAIDSVLLIVEIAAVLGLGYIFLNMMGIIRELNAEAATFITQPTLTPTPLIMAVVLPSGHTPPNEDGIARYNEAEIPEHLRPLVQSLEAVPTPTAGPQHAIQIDIPAIRLKNIRIVFGDGWEQLKMGVGFHIGSANPGDDGNMVLSAHNDVYGEIFKDLDKLKPGDVIFVYTNTRMYTYIVQGTRIVEPDAVEVMDYGNDPIVTLISCYPYQVDNMRIVVTGLLSTDGQ